MSKITYKEYTPEEDRIYNAAMAKIREGFQRGLNFDDACGAIDVQDKDLKEFILDDALKIMIAELHYGKGISLDQVAERLNVPLARIAMASMEMLEDAGIAAAGVFKRENPDTPIGHA